MTYRELWNDLVGSIPRLPPPLAQSFINRSWHDIADFRLWSWLFPIGYIVAPQNISVGTASVSTGSDVVTMDANAAAALNAISTAGGAPPLDSTQVGIGRQFRIASQTSGTPGSIYNIKSWDGVSSLQLDRPFAEVGFVASPYMIYKCYYQTPPSNGSKAPDFLRYVSITNPASGYTIRRRKLYYRQEQLNGIDPQRGATGDAYVISNYPDDPSTDATVHEWYPHPVNLRVYQCMYQMRGNDISDSNQPPSKLPSDLILERAYMHASKWAQKQVSVWPELAQTNWVMIYNQHKEDFKERLLQCIKTDDETSPLVAFQQGGVFDYPLGGQFLQNHDVSSLVGGLD